MNKQSKEQKIDNEKIQFWHIDYDVDNLDEIFRLSKSTHNPNTCSELTDDNQLLSFIF